MKEHPSSETNKLNNPHRISITKLCEMEGQPNIEELILAYADESGIPALCDEQCYVEHDGICPHGCPSPMRVMGMI